MLKKVSKAAITTVVTLDQMKEHLRIDNASFDNEILLLMESASDYIESQTGRAYALQQWQLICDSFSTEMQLPKPALQSIVSVTYYDDSNVQQTLDPSAYYTMQPTSDYGYIKLKQSAPSVYSRPDAITIEFTASSSSETFQHLLKVVTSLMNEEREGWKEIDGVKSLIGSLKTGKYI